MMKVKILGKFEYQTFPIVDDMVEIEESLIEEIGKTKQFDVVNKTIIPYDNTDDLINEQKHYKIAQNKLRLTKLTEDIIQSFCGENVPNIEDRKKEFVNIHNELRVLEGKLPRE